MGKITTPKYRVEYRTNTTGWCNNNVMAWRGKVSVERLEDWRKVYNQSFQPGEINGRYAPGEVVVHIIAARIVRQSDGEVVAETAMPAFEVV